MTDINKSAPALNDEELEAVSGGEYGDLLKPILVTYKAICTCGYEEIVSSARYGKVLCPACKALITEYKQSIFNR